MNPLVLRQIEDFRGNKQMLLKAYEKGGDHGIREMCVLAGIPVYVGFILVNELYNKTELAVISESLLRFYGYN